MSSPEIKKTDTEVVIKFPKHSDLDIKFYNPEIFHSLGFKNVSIHLDTLESGESEETASIYGGGLLDYEPTPEQPIETLSYPYRYFAYMFRAFNPSAKSDANSNGVNDDRQTKPSGTGEIEPKGLMSSIMGLADLSSNNNKPQLMESKDKEEVEKENGFFSMFVNKNKQPATATATDKQEPSIIDSLFPAENPPTPATVEVEEKTPEQKEPSAENPPTPATVEVEEKTPEQKEPSIIDSLFPAENPPTPATVVEVEEKTSEQKEPSIIDSLFPAENPPTPATVEVEEKTSEQKEPSIIDSLFPAENTPTDIDDNQGVATMNEVTPDAVVTSLPATEPEPAPVVPFAPITTPFSANWVIHFPIVDNNSQDDGGDVATKDNELFDDVLLFSEIEAKNGIYVRGNFVEILGRKIKIGVVEQLSSGENMRTIKEYLSNGRPLLEGTRMQKYSLLFSS